MEKFTIKEKTLDYLSEVVDIEFIKSNPELTGSLIGGLINTIRIKNKTLSEFEKEIQKLHSQNLIAKSLLLADKK